MAKSNFHTSFFTLQFFVCLSLESDFPTFVSASNFHASALKTFGGNNCLFSNWICLRNFGSTAL